MLILDLFVYTDDAHECRTCAVAKGENKANFYENFITL